MINEKWKNGKELTRLNASRCGEEGNNPVRDYSLVEKRSTPTPPRMPSGMRPAFDKQGCIPTECPVLWVNTIFYSAINVSSLTAIKTTEYVGNMIYENGALKRILVDGGYFENGIYYFYVTDHQGNNRSVVSSSANWVQGNHYYPFGMAFAETSMAQQGAQPYKYNGKELDIMSGLNQYDYGARYYDPVIARFISVDPLCEKYYWISPYAYCMNNPVRFVDPTGMDPDDNKNWNFIQWFKDLFSVKIDVNSQKTIEQSLQKLETNKETVKQIGDGIHTVADALTAVNPFGSILKTAATLSAGEKPSGGDMAFAALELLPVVGGEIGFAAKATETIAEGGEALVETASGILKPGGAIIGKADSSASIRELSGGLETAQSYWSRLVTSGAKPVLGTSYKGTLMELPNGGTVGFRTMMTKSPSTTATIDVNIPELFQGKLKFNP